MFRFASPVYFLLFLAIPIVLFIRRRLLTQPSMRVTTLEGASRISGSFFVHTRHIVPFLKYFALVLMIIAMARPQWGTKHVNVLTEGVNMILAVDVSGSMEALDFKRDGKVVNRLEAVKGVITDFIKKRSGDRIGMVVFGTNAFTQLPLTRDYNTISFVLDRLKIGSAGNSTAIGDAIGISLKRLEDIKSKSNIIILLSDGESNAGELTPDAASEIAEVKNVKIYTIGVGTKGKAPFKVKNSFFGERYVYQKVNIDEKTLKEIAEKTGGLYFRAENTKGLGQIYDTIDRLEKTEVKVKTFAEYKEYYLYILGPALLLLIVSVLLENTRYLRIP